MATIRSPVVLTSYKPVSTDLTVSEMAKVSTKANQPSGDFTAVKNTNHSPDVRSVSGKKADAISTKKILAVGKKMLAFGKKLIDVSGSSKSASSQQIVLRSVNPIKTQQPVTTNVLHTERLEAGGLYVGRNASDDGRKSALDAVSYLANSVEKSDKFTLTANKLHEIDTLIKDNKLTSQDVKNCAVTAGDLQLIRELTLKGPTGLASEKPHGGLLLSHLDKFIKETNATWSSANKNNPEALVDQEARRTFTRDQLTSRLNSQSTAEKMQILKNMEGEFGQRFRGVLDFTAEKVGQNSDDMVFISTAYKYATTMEDLIVTLRQQLGKEETIVSHPVDIRQLSELRESEIQALSLVGIERSMLE